MRQRVDDERQEQREEGQDDRGNDVLLEILPDEEDEGLHRIDEPVEAGGGTTGRTEKTRLSRVRASEGLLDYYGGNTRKQ